MKYARVNYFSVTDLLLKASKILSVSILFIPLFIVFSMQRAAQTSRMCKANFIHPIAAEPTHTDKYHICIYNDSSVKLTYSNTDCFFQRILTDTLYCPQLFHWSEQHHWSKRTRSEGGSQFSPITLLTMISAPVCTKLFHKIYKKKLKADYRHSWPDCCQFWVYNLFFNPNAFYK